MQTFFSVFLTFYLLVVTSLYQRDFLFNLGLAAIAWVLAFLISSSFFLFFRDKKARSTIIRIVDWMIGK